MFHPSADGLTIRHLPKLGEAIRHPCKIHSEFAADGREEAALNPDRRAATSSSRFPNGRRLTVPGGEGSGAVRENATTRMMPDVAGNSAMRVAVFRRPDPGFAILTAGQKGLAIRAEGKTVNIPRMRQGRAASSARGNFPLPNAPSRVTNVRPSAVNSASRTAP